MSHFLGLRTGKVVVPDLARAKRWYADAFGVEPYFDEPFYVGFDIGGFELGLDPDMTNARTGPGGTTTYWGVRDAEAALAHLLAIGATAHEPLTDVGGGIKVATVLDPFGNPLGIIENPHFKGA
ncbi:MAG TPA: VOC family protein [Gemmatimonadales bacterium]|nr:VOC family protein [Gemmatimonadales bacterium]